MPNTLTIGDVNNKLYRLSGQFSTTIKTSQSVSTWTGSPTGVSWDDTNTLFSGTSLNDKLYLLSGLFSSTLKTSQDVNSVDTNPTDISCDNTNTPWCGIEAYKLYLQSGRFSSTIKTSQGNLATNRRPQGISWDNVNTPWCANIPVQKLYIQSGQFSSTVKTSLETVGGAEPWAITFSAGNTPWVSGTSDKLYLQSGQFSSTIKTSQSIATIDGWMHGIETEPYGNRLGYNQSLTSAISLSSVIDAYKIHVIQHGFTISQFIEMWGGAYNRNITHYLSLLPFVRYDGNGQYTTVERGLRQDIVQQFLPNRIQYNDLHAEQQINYSLIRTAGIPRSVQTDITLGYNFTLSRSLCSDLIITQTISGISAKAPKSVLIVNQSITLQLVKQLSVISAIDVHSTHTHYAL